MPALPRKGRQQVSLTDPESRQCGARPEKVTGDAGFFSGRALHAMKQQGVDLYVPDNNLKHEMQTGERARGIGNHRIRRQAVVEPVFGILKQQRGMRKLRRRGLAAVSTEWMLAAIAYNLTRMARVAS